jgi:hypothetical protein
MVSLGFRIWSPLRLCRSPLRGERGEGRRGRGGEEEEEELHLREEIAAAKQNYRRR